jgi:hypothetical protein
MQQPQGESMYWIAFGDVHESTAAMADIPGIREAAGVIVTGDLTNCGGKTQAGRVLEAIRTLNPVIHAQPGNMDTQEVTRFLEESGVMLHRQVRELAPDLCLIGVGYSTPTPFNTPGEVPETDIAAWLDELDEASAGYSHRILAIHEPPGESALDVVGGGQHVGSAAVRSFIEKARLDLVITGHIHEAKGRDDIGGTPVFNPGMVAGGGFVRIEFADGKVAATLESV